MASWLQQWVWYVYILPVKGKSDCMVFWLASTNMESKKNGTEWSLQYSISFCKGDEILVTVSAVLKCQYKQKSVLVFRLAAVQSCILVLTNCHVISWQDESLLLRNEAETTGGKKKNIKKKPTKLSKPKHFSSAKIQLRLQVSWSSFWRFYISRVQHLEFFVFVI